MGRIDTELSTIQSGRYGQDVRMAIHDALDILEQTTPVGFPMPMDFTISNTILPLMRVFNFHEVN